MLKRFTKGLIAGTLAAVMAVTMVFAAAPMKAAKAASQSIDYDEVLSYGWTRGSGDTLTMSKTIQVRRLTDAGKSTVIDLPGHPVFNETDDGFRENVNYNNGVVRNVDVSAVNGTATVYYQYDLINAPSSDTIVLSLNNVEITGIMGSSMRTYTFVYTIYIQLVDETAPDRDSLNEGWQTSDNGRTYTMTYDAFQLGEGIGTSGRPLPVALPPVGTYDLFAKGDIQSFDATTNSFINNIEVDSSNRMMYIHFIENLTPLAQKGTFGQVILRKTVTNASGVNATYTLTAPIRVMNLSNAQVNGRTGPATLYFDEGASNTLSCTNIQDPSDAVVHWTTDASGYVDVANMNSMPKIDRLGRIDISSLKAGTYYFYIQSAGNLETRTYTVVVRKKSAPPTPVVNTTPLYRLVNTLSGEVLYTAQKSEYDQLPSLGAWKQEPSPGSVNNAVAAGTISVYRLFNPGTGEHMYTSQTSEISDLTKKYGWVVDNNGLPYFHAFTAGTGANGFYRVYNPSNPPATQHVYVVGPAELNVYLSRGGYTADNYAKPFFDLK